MMTKPLTPGLTRTPFAAVGQVSGDHPLTAEAPWNNTFPLSLCCD